MGGAERAVARPVAEQQSWGCGAGGLPSQRRVDEEEVDGKAPGKFKM